MQKNKKSYKPIELANLYNIHPNTIRLYERLGYISPAKRCKNNYREFSQLHVMQIKICRCIFGYPFTNRRIRNAGNEVMWAAAKKQWDLGKQYANDYIQVIEQEIDLAQKTADVLQKWASPEKIIKNFEGHKSLSRKEIAELLGITVEAVRNWERNYLISSDIKGQTGEVRYRGIDLDRLKVIYMLRQAGYSMTSIHHSISMYDKGQSDKVLTALNEPEPDDLISVGDRWLYELSKLMDAAQKIPPIFNEMETL